MMTTHNPGRVRNIRENLYFQTCWHRELILSLSAFLTFVFEQTHQKATRTRAKKLYLVEGSVFPLERMQNRPDKQPLIMCKSCSREETKLFL